MPNSAAPCRPTRSARDRTPRGLAIATLSLALALIAACSVRLDTPPPAIPSPDQQETIRQGQAERVEWILDLVEATTHEADIDDDVIVMLDTVAADAQDHLAALGGVWQPPPRPEDAESPTTDPTTDADEGPDPYEDPDAGSGPDADDGPDADSGADHILSALEASAEAARLAAPDVEGELATLLVSIGTNHLLRAESLRSALGIDAPEPEERPDDPYPQTLGAEADTLCRVLDAGGYIAELRAARTSGDERTRLQERGERLRALADLIAIRAGFAGTADDPRRARYDVDPEDLAGEAIALELALVPAWLDLLAPAEGADRELIAWQVYTAATSAYGSDVPTFPGRG